MRQSSKVYAGIDIGSVDIHWVGIDYNRGVLSAGLHEAGDLGDLVDWCVERCRGAVVVCVDAPDRLSTNAHTGDEGEPQLSRKFRSARCAEVALGREYKCWVPWVTPISRADCPPWMLVGFAVFEALSAAGIDAIETYPHAGFRELASRKRLPAKSKVAGRSARAALLESAGLRVGCLSMWTDHALDACLAALVALEHAQGIARGAGCGHDGSVIWMPNAPTAALD